MTPPNTPSGLPVSANTHSVWSGLGWGVAAGIGAAFALALGDFLRMKWAGAAVAADSGWALATGSLALGGLVAVLALLVRLLRRELDRSLGQGVAIWGLALLVSLPFIPLVQGTLSGRWLRSSGWAGPSTALALLCVLLAARAAIAYLPKVIDHPWGPRAVGVWSLLVLVWLCDWLVLPRLYPDFHTALSLVFVLGAGALGGGVLARVLSGGGCRKLFTLLAALLLFVPLGAARLGHIPGSSQREQEVLLWLAPMNSRLIVHLPWVFAGQRGSEDDVSNYIIRRPVKLQAEVLDQTVPNRKNLSVLLITIDALRADELSCYRGSAKATPTLDALAQQSVLFEHAYATHPSSQLSLASLFKGRYPTGTDIMGRRNLPAQLRRPPRDLPLAELLRREGRKTYGLSALPRSYTEGEFAYLNAGFDEFNPKAHSRPLDASDVSKYAIDVLEQHGASPFFLWLHYFDPHAPYRPHTEGSASLSRRERYTGEVQHTDRHLAGVLAALERLALAEHTIVVLHADHGEEFEEHGGSFHGSSLYEEQLRVPLMLRIPGIPGQRIRTPTALVDVLPTLAELVGFNVPHVVHGESLLLRMRPFADEADDARDHVAFAQRVDRVPEQDALRFKHWKLIMHRRTGLSELYDLRKDPSERKSVAAQYPEELAQLQSMLLAHRRLADDGVAPAPPKPGSDHGTTGLEEWAMRLRAEHRDEVLDEIVAALLAQSPDSVVSDLLSQSAPYLRAQDLSRLKARVLRGSSELKERYVFALAFQNKSYAGKALEAFIDDASPGVQSATQALRRFTHFGAKTAPIDERCHGEAWLLWRLAQLRDSPAAKQSWGFAGLLNRNDIRFDLQLLCQISALRSGSPAFPIASYLELLDPKCRRQILGYCLAQKQWIQLGEHAPLLRKFLALFANDPEARGLRNRLNPEQFNAMESVDALILDARDRGARGPLQSVLDALQSARRVAGDAGYSDWGVWLETLMSSALAGVLSDAATLNQQWLPVDERSSAFARRMRERLSSWKQQNRKLRGRLSCSHWEPVLNLGTLWALEVVIHLDSSSAPILGIITAGSPKLRVSLIPKQGEAWVRETKFPLGFGLPGESQPMIVPLVVKALPKGEYQVRVEVVRSGAADAGIDALLLPNLKVR